MTDYTAKVKHVDTRPATRKHIDVALLVGASSRFHVVMEITTCGAM